MDNQSSKLVYGLHRLHKIVERMGKVQEAPFMQTWDDIGKRLNQDCKFFKTKKRKWGSSFLGNDIYPYCKCPTYIYVYLKRGEFVNSCGGCNFYENKNT